MTILEAIDVRSSKRKYLASPIDDNEAGQLTSLINSINEVTGLHFQFIQNNGDAFNSFLKSYGLLTGVTNYFALVGKDDPGFKERCGYFGEKLVLNATMLGLGTCWVGGTFDKHSCVSQVRQNETLCCVIAVGNTPDSLSTREKLISKLVHRKTKKTHEMYQKDEQVPEWFMAGMRAVQRAPSAANRQPVMFSYNGGRVTASMTENKSITPVDLGIAKLHFELGSGGGSWQWGNGGEFTAHK